MAEKTLAQALALAQGEFKPIQKDKIAKIRTKTGGEYTYQYADYADVLKMALPALAKNGLAFTQPLRYREGQLFVTSELLFENEKLVSDGIPIKFDLMSPQEFGSCLTYWRRYDGCSLLGIQPDKDDDGQAAQSSHKSFGRSVDAEKRFEDARISEANKREFWKEVRKTGKSNDEVAAYLKELGHVQTEELTQAEYGPAMEWAKKPSPAPQDLTGALQASLDMAKAKKKAVDPFWASLWASAKKHGVSEDDVHQYARETFGMPKLESLKELSQVQLGKVIEWIASVEA